MPTTSGLPASRRVEHEHAGSYDIRPPSVRAVTSSSQRISLGPSNNRLQPRRNAARRLDATADGSICQPAHRPRTTIDAMKKLLRLASSASRPTRSVRSARSMRDDLRNIRHRVLRQPGQLGGEQRVAGRAAQVMLLVRRTTPRWRCDCDSRRCPEPPRQGGETQGLTRCASRQVGPPDFALGDFYHSTPVSARQRGARQRKDQPPRLTEVARPPGSCLLSPRPRACRARVSVDASA